MAEILGATRTLDESEGPAPQSRRRQRRQTIRRAARTPENEDGWGRAALGARFDCDKGPGHRSGPRGAD
eukprot:2691020-Alexandrium_andersonii.AAC.1